MAVRSRSTAQKKWVIRCKAGTFVTLSITHFAAQDVATWCDHNYPNCKPHIIEPRGKDDGVPLRPL